MQINLAESRDKRSGSLITNCRAQDLLNFSSNPYEIPTEDKGCYPLDQTFIDASYILNGFTELLSNKVLIDLGCGYNPAGAEIAYKNGAKGYIGVDLFLPYSSPDLSSEFKQFKLAHQATIGFNYDQEYSKSLLDIIESLRMPNNRNPMPVALISINMIDFLKVLEADQDVAFLIYGIDSLVLNDSTLSIDLPAQIAKKGSGIPVYYEGLGDSIFSNHPNFKEPESGYNHGAFISY